MADGDLLLTGATGFVGMEILARFLERTDRRIYTLVRAEDEEQAGERLRSTMDTLFGQSDGYAERVVAVPGDIETEGLGLDDESRDRLAGQVGDIVHSAASVSFSLPLRESREINVEGTGRLLEFAELCRDRGGLGRFSYVSTAYVAGTHAGEFREDQLDVGQEFRNAYERSKFEAEQLVRSYSGRLPIQVFRPSIVVGERSTGWTASFNVLYAPLKAFARGAYFALPVRRRSPVDVVPVDYVADAIYELARNGPNRTYNLVAGHQATTVGKLIELASGHFEKRPPPTFPPELYKRLVYPLMKRRLPERARDGLRRIEVFFPYFSMQVRYDDRRARERLEPLGIKVTPVDGYFHRLLDYAKDTHWGRRQLGRAEAREQAGQDERLPLTR
jgi:thioester reductase-like protein